MEPSSLEYLAAGAQPFLKYTEYDASPFHRNRLSSIIALIQVAGLNRGEGRVLDIGCGRGNIARPIASLGYETKGIDIHQATVDGAESWNPFTHLAFEFAECDGSRPGPF